jgi:hypothetical protein
MGGWKVDRRWGGLLAGGLLLVPVGGLQGVWLRRGQLVCGVGGVVQVLWLVVVLVVLSSPPRVPVLPLPLALLRLALSPPHPAPLRSPCCCPLLAPLRVPQCPWFLAPLRLAQ